MSKSILKSVITSLLFAFSTNVSAENFNQFLDNAKAAYEEKDYELAKLELQDAMKTLNKIATDILIKTFPEAPEGWTADKIRNESNAMTGSIISRNYKQDRKSIKATLTHNSPMISSFATIFANPMMMQGEKVRIGRSHAMLQMRPNSKNSELTYLIKGKYLIQLKGRNIEDKQILIDLIKNWDLKTIKSMVIE